MKLFERLTLNAPEFEALQRWVCLLLPDSARPVPAVAVDADRPDTSHVVRATALDVEAFLWTVSTPTSGGLPVPNDQDVLVLRTAFDRELGTDWLDRRFQTAQEEVELMMVAEEAEQSSDQDAASGRKGNQI